jgi:hypothetical protein
MNGEDVPRSPSAADLFSESDQCRVRHERARPEPFVQLGFAHHARRLGEQQRDQVEGFRCEMNGAARVVRDLPTVRIEHEPSESRCHGNSRQGHGRQF